MRTRLAPIFYYVIIPAVGFGLVGFLTADMVGDQQQHARQIAATETAATQALTARGEHVDSMDCASLTRCTAIIDGDTYLVTIQTGTDGEKVYGLSAYAPSR